MREGCHVGNERELPLFSDGNARARMQIGAQPLEAQ
jgi:hypothetical protein